MGDLLFAGRAPRLWLRVEQDADKLYYLQVPPELVDGFVINANLVEHSPDAVASFLDRLEKPFLIDPMSYRFRQPAWLTRERDGDTVNKRNYTRLWAKYVAGVPGMTGDPLRDRGGVSITGDAATLRYCENVVEYQDRRLRAAWIEEVAQFVGMDRLFGYQLAPTAYIAPYVVIGEDDIAAETIRAVNFASATASLGRPPVIAVLPVTRAVLGSVEAIRHLAGGIGASGVRAALVWTVGTPALALADSPELFTGLVLLVRQLADSGIEVGMLYGGFFSTLLRGFGLDGFSHAVMYGESRGLEPSGGRPSTRFYFPPLRSMIPYSLASDLIGHLSATEYLDRVCGCEICQSLVRSGKEQLRAFFETYRPEGSTRMFPTQAALDLNRFHYLFARGTELEMARTLGEPGLIAALLDAVDRYPTAATRELRAWTLRLRSA